MKKTRIISRTNVFKNTKFVIQQKHWLFFWIRAAASFNHEYAEDTFDTFQEAKNNMCLFDGTKIIEKVIA